MSSTPRSSTSAPLSMRALFEIRGKMLYAETDSSLPHDTIKVHSLDAFAKMLDSLDAETTGFVAESKNGSVAPVKRRPSRRKATATTVVVPELPPDLCPPTPKGGWRTDTGHVIILGNFGVTREQVAVAVRDHGDKLTADQLKLISMRFGLGNIKARPHSTEEVAAHYNFGSGTTGQAAVSSLVRKALRSMGLRIRGRRRK